MDKTFHEAAIQMARDKVNAIKRNLNACEYISKFLLVEYNVRATQLSILTDEPFVEYERKKKRRGKMKKL